MKNLIMSSKLSTPYFDYMDTNIKTVKKIQNLY